MEAGDSSLGVTRMAIEKFDGKKNFSMWQVRMKDALVQQGIEDALYGEDSKPEGMTDKVWKRINAKAVSTIRLSLVDDVVYDVMGETSAKALWEKLEDLYLGKNFTNRLMLKQELYSFRRKEGVDLQAHIGEFNKLLCELSNVGFKLDDEDKAIILLTSVKSTHNQLFNTLLYGRDTITVEQVKKALLSSEKMDNKEGKSEDTQALVTQERPRHGKKNSSGDGSGGARRRTPMKDKECYYCGEKGHFIRDCPAKKDNRGATTNVMEQSDEDVVEVMTITEDKKKTADWVLDSACFAHLCSHVDWFSSYKPKEGKVYMANNTVGEIKGVGTVRIKTSNGLTRLLTDVLHVPGLRRNVISLGVLDSKGCSVVANRGLMKVKRDSRIMFLGKKVGNLYVLLGSTDFGDVTKDKREWKPVRKLIERIDDKAPTTSVMTTSTQGEDDHNSKAELVRFVIDDVGKLEFVGDANLSNGVAE